MANEIRKTTRNEIINAPKERYRKATKKEKKQILDEFTAVSGYHRKHASRLLIGKHQINLYNKKITNKRLCEEAVKDASIIVWEAADRICSKRLKAVILALLKLTKIFPEYTEMEQHSIRYGSAFWTMHSMLFLYLEESKFALV